MKLIVTALDVAYNILFGVAIGCLIIGVMYLLLTI